MPGSGLLDSLPDALAAADAVGYPVMLKAVGGGGGIGRATALLCAREGAHVVGCDLHPQPSEETVALVRAGGGRMDAIAPVEVGEYVRDAIADSTFVMLDAVGHCPNLSAPEQTVDAIATFLDSRAAA